MAAKQKPFWQRDIPVLNRLDSDSEFEWLPEKRLFAAILLRMYQDAQLCGQIIAGNLRGIKYKDSVKMDADSFVGSPESVRAKLDRDLENDWIEALCIISDIQYSEFKEVVREALYSTEKKTIKRRGHPTSRKRPSSGPASK